MPISSSTPSRLLPPTGRNENHRLSIYSVLNLKKSHLLFGWVRAHS